MQSLPDIPPDRAGRGGAPLSRAPEHGFQRARARRRSSSGVVPCSAIRALPRCSRRAAAPRFRSSAASDGRTVTGVVDRLVVAPDAVLIADYKTNRPAPRSLAETQERYQRLYQAAGALPRGADAALSRPAGPRRFGVDGYPRPGGNSRRSAGCGARSPHHPVMRLDAPRRRPYVPGSPGALFPDSK